ncbi:hypothetical protein K4L06_04785 [Lysobacter sp. BMK333-48F3]|uniref:hypothetical protein n=1 Tax=Lysobacter sp. BMK333-48F3 TaxID=2867962 RepID=UPI001C8B3A2E|nr:hypothetical protein [Lysobacter sp. BMK333-48F3]MBX9400617.1 hypothetical protein [Lysobacter sp. BMK333-48F3]
MDLPQLGEFLLGALLSAVVFLANVARPRFLGVVSPNLGHVDRDDLVKSLNQTLLISAVATVACLLLYDLDRPERAFPVLGVAAGTLAVYTVAMFRLK